MCRVESALSVRKKIFVATNAFSFPKVTFWREVCGNDEKLHSRAPF